MIDELMTRLPTTSRISADEEMPRGRPWLRVRQEAIRRLAPERFKPAAPEAV